MAQDQVNILLVDDQPAKLLSYEAILEELGETLVKANSAQEALTFLLKNDVAVVLIDVCMPELDGFELARMLRDHPRFEKTAIIFISAIQISDVDRVRGYETGAVDYVPVPVVPEILRAKVRIFTDLWRKTRQLERVNDELERRVRERTAELEVSSAKVHETAERLRLASEAAGFGTYDYHPAAGQVYWSPYLRLLTGLADGEPLNLDRALAVVHPDHRDMVRSHIDSYSPDGERRELEFKIVRPDGEVRWLLDRGQAFSGVQGSELRIMGTILDITERKQNEERQRLLMAELDHRVKNILGNVMAMARLSSRSAQSVSDFVESLDGRIQAISSAHGLLRRGAWLGADLGELVAGTLSPYRNNNNIEIDGAEVHIVPELAQSMALLLHELATNATKHGALSKPGGRISVSWSRVDEGHLRLLWQETVGQSVTMPPATGFGLTVLRTAASDLGAKSHFTSTERGFVYTLEGPFETHQPASVRSADGKLVASASSPDAVPECSMSPCRILVVEDETLVALQLQGDLEDEGHEVVGPAMSLEQGLKLATQEPIDAALVDVRLGRETSAPIADTLLARRIPFAFATGYTDVTMLPDHLRQVPKLGKPYVKGDMRRILKHLIAQGRAVPKPAIT